MDAVKFLIARSRMCNAQGDCKTCLIDAECFKYFVDHNFSTNVVEKMVSTIEQWAKDNPAKTRQSEFLKMFPNSVTDRDGVILICPHKVDETLYRPCDSATVCTGCKRRRDYWLRDVE